MMMMTIMKTMMLMRHDVNVDEMLIQLPMIAAMSQTMMRMMMMMSHRDYDEKPSSSADGSAIGPVTDQPSMLTYGTMFYGDELIQN